jgi:sulfite exporter TauE/SafE
MELWTALIIGFGGSFHCIGMCGPIALALPVPATGNTKFASSRILYNFGRIISYMLMGGVFGFLGGKVMMFGLQQFLSVAIGVLILLFLVIPRQKRIQLTYFPVVRKRVIILQNSIRNLFSKNTKSSFLIIGILNGFLPCGFVYIGLSQASLAGGFYNGILVMLMFGIGTYPAMLAASVFGKLISIETRRKLTRMLPYMAAVLAVIFILRGMGLGIPYLSPRLSGGMMPHNMMQHNMMHCN